MQAIANRAFVAEVRPGALRLALKFNRLTYRKAEILTDVSKSTIGNLASGKVKTCNPETAGKLAAGLGVQTSELFLLKATHNPDSEGQVAA